MKLLSTWSIETSMKSRIGFTLFKNRPKFIHVGKTGGSTLEHLFNLRGDEHLHLTKPVHTPGSEYYTILRNPLDRTQSAFNMYLSVWKFDPTKDFRNGNPIPEMIRSIEKQRHPKNPKYASFNDWAEAGCPLDEELWRGDGLTHLREDYRYYLGDIPRSSIVYVGKMENMDEVIERVSQLLEQEPKESQRQFRENKLVSKTPLTTKARKNLRRFLAPEYNFLEEKFRVSYPRP
jgi:hypothetical protein